MESWPPPWVEMIVIFEKALLGPGEDHIGEHAGGVEHELQSDTSMPRSTERDALAGTG
jgi:hypothetical protein